MHVCHNLLTRFRRARSWVALCLRQSPQWLWSGHGGKSCAETMASACIPCKFWSGCSHRGPRRGSWPTGCKPPTSTTQSFRRFTYLLFPVTLGLRDIWLASGEETNRVYDLIAVAAANKHNDFITQNCIGNENSFDEIQEYLEYIIIAFLYFISL